MPYSEFFGVLYANPVGLPHLSQNVQAYPERSLAEQQDIDAAGTKGFINSVIYSTDLSGVSGFDTFLQDFYFRIHVIPRIADLGNIGSDQEQTIKVWNSFLEPKTLLSVEGEDEGLVITGPQVPPFNWKPLLIQDWVLSVAADGPSVLSGNITWNFSDVDVGLGLGGTRVTAWTLREDWSTQIVERMEWLTTVTMADVSGKEQRRKLRLTPRISLSLQSIAKSIDRKYIEGLVYSAGGRRLALPFAPQTKRIQAPLTAGATEINISTANLFFREGGNIVLHNNNPWENEVAEIDTVTPSSIMLVRPLLKDWPTHTRISPVRIGRMTTQPDVRRLTDDLISLMVDLQQTEREPWTGTPDLPLYRSRPVLVTRPDESEDLTYTYQRYFKTLDNRTSHPLIVDSAEFATPVQGFRWFLAGEVKQADFRSLMYYMSGRWRSIWVPSFFDDLELLANVPEAGMVIEVRWAYYSAQNLHQFPGRRDLYILTKTGQHYFARVSGSEPLVEGESERLTLSSPFGANIAVEDIQRVSFMSRMRLDQDYVEVAYQTDSEGLATAYTVFKGVLDD